MTEFSVRLANRPGQLAALTRLLADAGIEIEALATVADNGQSYVHIVVHQAARVRRVLMNADLEFMERDVLDIFLARGTGSLSQVAEGLARSNVNIESMYLLHSDAEGFHLAVTVNDEDAAIEVLTG
jgi:hypothetical protein